MTKAWFIDALDARAGLAFASYRQPDLTEENPDIDLPCVFFEPPSFRPEAVSSRGPAFAASQGSLQLGLFLQEAEIGFPTLEDVIEFVRRAFLRSAGGDGSSGIGPGVPVPPDVGPEGGSLEDAPRPETLSGDGEGNAIASLLAEVRHEWLDKGSDGSRPSGTRLSREKPSPHAPSRQDFIYPPHRTQQARMCWVGRLPNFFWNAFDVFLLVATIPVFSNGLSDRWGWVMRSRCSVFGRMSTMAPSHGAPRSGCCED